MKKKFYYLLVIGMVLLILGFTFVLLKLRQTDHAAAINLQIDEITIDLPGVEGSYDLLFVNDMHILTVDESVVADQVPVAQQRYDNMFRSATGTYSPDTWLHMASVIADWEADGVIFGGDMMDFISEGNIKLFQKGLEKIKTPYMYLRADHDQGTWYSGYQLTDQDAVDMQKEICEYQDMFVQDFGEFYVLGWNNSTSQLSEAGLQLAESIWDDGKPIILATHVPLNSLVDTSLAEAAAAFDHKGRKKLWGLDCLYYPNGTTVGFMNMVFDKESPVKAVLSGHLHFKHMVPLSEETMQYVFAPSFEGNMAHIIVE